MNLGQFHIFSLFLVFQFTCQTQTAHSSNENNLQDKANIIDQYVRGVLSCNGSEAVSLALAVVKNGSKMLTKSYGYADYWNNVSVTNDTKFCIASCSKAFTATLIAKLLERNKSFTFDTKVKDILKNFTLGDNYTTHHVTIRDLLSHRTGMSRHDYAWVLGGLTKDEFFRRVHYLNATSGFRDKVIYNNWMYGVASRVAEVLGGNGKSFEVLLQEEILDPLGMKQTTQIYNLKPEDEDYAKFYFSIPGGPKEVDVSLYVTLHLVDGAAGLCSTPSDMSKWLAFHLRNGALENGTQPVSKASLDITKTSRNVWEEVAEREKMYAKPTIPFTDVRNKYALGWYEGYYRGIRTVSHEGALFGQTSLVMTIPEEGIAIYTSVSGTLLSDPQRPMSLYIADILMGLEPWLNVPTTCTFPEPWHPAPTKNDTLPQSDKSAQRDLAEYTGRFGNYFYGNITIEKGKSENGTGEELKFFYGSLGNFTLLPTEEKDVFSLYAAQNELLWFLKYTVPVKVNFSSSEQNKDVLDTMVVDGIDTATPVFLRDLKLPPTSVSDTYCTCKDIIANSTSTLIASFVSVLIYGIITLAIIYIAFF